MKSTLALLLCLMLVSCDAGARNEPKKLLTKQQSSLSTARQYPPSAEEMGKSPLYNGRDLPKSSESPFKIVLSYRWGGEDPEPEGSLSQIRNMGRAGWEVVSIKSDYSADYIAQLAREGPEALQQAEWKEEWTLIWERANFESLMKRVDDLVISGVDRLEAWSRLDLELQAKWRTKQK